MPKDAITASLVRERGERVLQGPPGSEAATNDPGAFDQKNDRVPTRPGWPEPAASHNLAKRCALTFLRLVDRLESGVPRR